MLGCERVPTTANKVAEICNCELELLSCSLLYLSEIGKILHTTEHSSHLRFVLRMQSAFTLAEIKAVDKIIEIIAVRLKLPQKCSLPTKN